MREEIEQKLLKEIEELKNKVAKLENIEHSTKPIYQYSKIKDSDLDNLVMIEKRFDNSVFDSWLNQENLLEDEEESKLFFQNIIDRNQRLINDYNEEDLKVNVIIPILNRVEFKSFENEFRDFYELPLRYETDNFIFKGTTDFVVSKGLVKSKKPYFFIQEFKRGEEYGNPRPQLLAELITGVELNGWSEMKGAYIIGAIWYFVILYKVDKDSYEYFVSNSFDSMNLVQLIDIYNNLLFVKNEIKLALE
jgi:hypothetical protein